LLPYCRSGGQQAQLALTLALARRPRLPILDEPVAMLDPVARHDFMATVLIGPAAEAGGYAGWPAVHADRAGDRDQLLVRAAADDPVPPGWEAHPAGLEELAPAYLREPAYAGLAAGLYLQQHYLTPLVTSNLSLTLNPSLNLPGSAWILSRWWTKGARRSARPR
jgi:hypothetical protein